ncbi:DUF3147 family protein [Sphingomonas lacunae]|uniref:DUF3147 family protein n=1 Tax=Sphingomonas lacunae TaxID=2698828 RepID=A0A6M4AVH8_9SPHN|nr:DUF3147 family protein [Sphingomonas lacunae]QJQ32696.1 DUF3147 family protein [Sphingomonas lacunae]
MTTAFLVRVVLSGLVVALIALVARKSPGLGGLIASLPLVSTLGMIWLWHDTGDRLAVADYVQSSLLYFLPSIPMFILIPWMLRHGWNFWLTLMAGALLTMLLYAMMNRWLASQGISL